MRIVLRTDMTVAKDKIADYLDLSNSILDTFTATVAKVWQANEDVRPVVV